MTYPVPVADQTGAAELPLGYGAGAADEPQPAGLEDGTGAAEEPHPAGLEEAGAGAEDGAASEEPHPPVG